MEMPKLELSASQLIRYSYSGLLFALLCAYVNRELTEQTVKALGPVLSPLVALVVGVGIYVCYREILGEFIIYPIRHYIHTGVGRVYLLVRRVLGKPPRELGCFTAFFGELGVPLFYRRWAYRSLRSSETLDAATRKKLDFLHAELHVLYITALETGLAGAYQMSRGVASRWFFVIAGVSFFFAYIVDIRQDGLETVRLRQMRADVEKHLGTLGFGVRARPRQGG